MKPWDLPDCVDAIPHNLDTGDNGHGEVSLDFDTSVKKRHYWIWSK